MGSSFGGLPLSGDGYGRQVQAWTGDAINPWLRDLHVFLPVVRSSEEILLVTCFFLACITQEVR